MELALRRVIASAKRRPAPVSVFVARARDWLPKGDLLNADEWRRRHQMIVRIVYAQAIALPLMAIVVGRGVVHGIEEAAPVFVLAFLAQHLRGVRASVVATLAMTSAIAIVVHLSGGSIEAHFLYFVAVGVIALYQSWPPFLAAVGFVIVQHGAMGVLDATTVYNHPAAIHNPWLWAAIHGTILLSACVVSITTWRIIEFHALHDALTKLANRRLFFDRMQHALVSARRYGGRVGVLYIDVDAFKTINDSFGHGAGDQALVHVAQSLRSSARQSDTVARLGGDEFVILLPSLHEDGEAMDVAQRLMESVSRPLVINGHDIVVGVSVGVAVADGARQADDLIQSADAALYSSKSSGKGKVSVGA
jgi:diguanylate cyclase (GGDEF)-like protein